jgi:UTP--glucose-1-phosphate uridylyltransferase
LIRKAVIPAAGLGTRLLSATKEMPKEMLPIFARANSGELMLKPMLQMIFEQLYDVGLREFCFIVGRGKRAIEDHFTQDYEYVEDLRRRGKAELASDLEGFYRRLEGSSLLWINQPRPRGFGDAVLRAEPFVGSERFIVHAGDTYVISPSFSHLQRLLKVHEELGADATFLVQEVEDPRQYGVVRGRELEEGVIKVEEAVEKPEELVSRTAIMPIYVFHPVIFKALEQTPPGRGGEVQLTDGIQRLISWGLRVYAVKLREEDVRLDIGNPEGYWEAVKTSFKYFSGLGK